MKTDQISRGCHGDQVVLVPVQAKPLVSCDPQWAASFHEASYWLQFC